MDVDKRLLAEHLQRLEQQAATVESLIDWYDADLVQQIADGWAPLPDGYHSSPQTRNRWRRQWVSWLRDAAERWEPKPAEGLDLW